MVIHPPSLYTGFVAATIPFAFGIGALASGRLDDMWLGSVRVWMMICFFFLSFGLILGGRWAYEELGWGGYWAWDPVENAGLMPWFTATAFLHSAIIQEQKGMMKGWNLLLVTLTFFLTIFGTFMTRSGAVQSVHAFGEDNVLALQFVVFMALILVVSIGLIIYRSNKLSTKTEFDSFYSREFAFLLNNWILLACAFFVLFATMFPTISEALDGSRVSVGPEFFNKWMTPLGLLLLVLAGAAPLLAWRKTTRERLFNQFLFPVLFMTATITSLVIFVPDVVHLSPIFADHLVLKLFGARIDLAQLPISLINFGICAFVLASIGQEFWRGMRVRQRQTGSDPFTSLLGLILVKRRKYGGYIIHLGVAMMFVGFAGKAYERMLDRTIDTPALSELAKLPSAQQQSYLNDDHRTLSQIPPGTKSKFNFGDYTFVYEDLIPTSDDHKVAITAAVSIWEGDSRIGMVYPAKWTYAKGEQQQTTEVAIKTKLGEDIYVVLTGYNTESRQANFRGYLNPLISWVWLGFMVLALGTFCCLIPQGVADRMQMIRPRTRVGRAVDLGIVLVIVGGIVMGLASQARAEPPAEHVSAGMGMGNAGGGWAAQNRPKNAVDERAMKELLCPCGGCTRQNLFTCDCSTAAQLRKKVTDMVLAQDLSTEAGRQQAYDAVIKSFVNEYGGEQVLATPSSQFSWLFPSLAAVGGLGLLFVVGRRWIRSGTATAVLAVPPPAAGEDEAYADKLDDELRDSND
jgi:cytochrome c-type biogenesis protein CcmF